jgi:hypothetical protein
MRSLAKQPGMLSAAPFLELANLVFVTKREPDVVQPV